LSPTKTYQPGDVVLAAHQAEHTQAQYHKVRGRYGNSDGECMVLVFVPECVCPCVWVPEVRQHQTPSTDTVARLLLRTHTAELALRL
jgi:hypothetical protein